jgi:hypothetical protein
MGVFITVTARLLLLLNILRLKAFFLVAFLLVVRTSPAHIASGIAAKLTKGAILARIFLLRFLNHQLL